MCGFAGGGNAGGPGRKSGTDSDAGGMFPGARAGVGAGVESVAWAK